MNTLMLEQDPVAIDVKFTEAYFIVELADGRLLSIPLVWYPRLAHATAQERTNWQFLGDGYAIEWPDLDEHIGVEGLLAGRSSGEREGSLQKWLASRQGAVDIVTVQFFVICKKQEVQQAGQPGYRFLLAPAEAHF